MKLRLYTLVSNAITSVRFSLQAECHKPYIRYRLNVALRCVATCRALDLLVHRNSDLVDVVVKRGFIPGRRVRLIERVSGGEGGGAHHHIMHTRRGKRQVTGLGMVSTYTQLSDSTSPRPHVPRSDWVLHSVIRSISKEPILLAHDLLR